MWGPIHPIGVLPNPAQGRVHFVKMLNKRMHSGIPADRFPYKTGEYAIDDKDAGKELDKFGKNARLLDPLSRMRGKKSHIGQHISICATPRRYHFVIYKGVPPKGLKILCQKIKQHISSCLLYTSPSPRARTRSRMPSSA